MPEAVKRYKLPRNSIQHPTTLKPSQLESDGAAYPVGGVGLDNERWPTNHGLNGSKTEQHAYLQNSFCPTSAVRLD